MNMYAAQYILILIVAISSNYASPEEDVTEIFLNNCFEQDETIECEKKRINISGTYYECNSTVLFDSPIKKIGFNKNEILVLIGRQTFIVDDKNKEIKPIKRVIRTQQNIIDKNGNSYWGDNSIVYYQESGNDEFIEVVTVDEDNVNQLALDEKGNKLFIQSTFTEKYTLVVKSILFYLDVNPLVIDQSQIIAHKLDEIGEITAIAFNEDQRMLYLGVKTEDNKGKLVRLKSQNNDPCSKHEHQKSVIIDVIAEFKEKIIEVIDNSTEVAETRGLLTTSNDDKINELKDENSNLNRQINILTQKISKLTDNLRTKYKSPGAFGYSSGGSFSGSGIGGGSFASSNYNPPSLPYNPPALSGPPLPLPDNYNPPALGGPPLPITNSYNYPSIGSPPSPFVPSYNPPSPSNHVSSLKKRVKSRKHSYSGGSSPALQFPIAQWFSDSRNSQLDQSNLPRSIFPTILIYVAPFNNNDKGDKRSSDLKDDDYDSDDEDTAEDDYSGSDVSALVRYLNPSQSVKKKGRRQ